MPGKPRRGRRPKHTAVLGRFSERRTPAPVFLSCSTQGAHWTRRRSIMFVVPAATRSAQEDSWPDPLSGPPAPLQSIPRLPSISPPSDHSSLLLYLSPWCAQIRGSPSRAPQFCHKPLSVRQDFFPVVHLRLHLGKKKNDYFPSS